MEAHTGELCCGTVTAPTPAKRSTDVSMAGSSLLPSTDTSGTICCSSTPLSYTGCATTSRGKPLLLQSLWASKDTRTALLNRQTDRQMLSFGIRGRYSCAGKCRSVWPVGCSALSLYLSKCLSGPDCCRTHTLQNQGLSK